ncbi:MAG TPA: NUDIX hydrolase [Candidatus Binataceae bacterium]|nr:NUDIX hydrolase [Candidatus Binataceae bacterium]
MEPTNRRPILKLGHVDLGVETAHLPNGVTIELAVIRHPGASAIVALDADGNIALLSQYRHAIGGYMREVPAGCRNPGEDFLVCARRELAEEAGLSAARWDRTGAIITIPSVCDEVIELFLARDLSDGAGVPDHDEVISVSRVPFEETFEMIRRGEIVDAKSIAALYRARDFLELEGRAGKK